MSSNAAISMSQLPRAEDFGVRSKVIVVEHDKDQLDALKHFIESCNLERLSGKQEHGVEYFETQCRSRRDFSFVCGWRGK